MSGFYATGFTAVVEGLRQIRGESGATQVPGAQVALVSGHGGNGGIQNTWAHATMVLGLTAHGLKAATAIGDMLREAPEG